MPHSSPTQKFDSAPGPNFRALVLKAGFVFFRLFSPRDSKTMPSSLVITIRNVLVGFSSCSPARTAKQVKQPRELRFLRYRHGFYGWPKATALPREGIAFDGGQIPPCPPYPYGMLHAFKNADKGLFGGAHVQSGNKISKGRNKGKTVDGGISTSD